MSILAGIFIGIGGIVYLSVGGVCGALLFAVGLLTICHFKYALFTGKTGFVLTGEIKISEILRIWLGNFVGTFIAASLAIWSGKSVALYSMAAALVDTRWANGPIVNLCLGIFCGMLMYVAVTGYAETKNVLFVFVPVAVFILSGFNHCVADMFYLHLAAMNVSDYAVLVPTTIGNLIGGATLGYCRKFWSF